MMVLKILGLLITAAAGARINVSNLPNSDRGVPQSVLNENLFNVYPHLVYVTPGSGVVVSRVGNVRNVNYGRKMFQEQVPTSFPGRGEIANEQFLKEVTPTTRTVLEKQQVTAPFMRAKFSSNIEGKLRDQDQYTAHHQVEENDDSIEQGHNANGPNPDFRVLFVQGNEPIAENNHYHQRLVYNVKPKSILGASQSLRKTHLRKPTKPQAIDYDYQEERTEGTLQPANHYVQFSQADNANEQIGLSNFQSSSNPQPFEPHRLQDELSEEELYSFYIKQLQQKLAHFVPKKTNVPESKTISRHKQLPVIFKTRNEQPYEENATPIRRSSPIPREFHYESLPYNHFIKKERAVQILQDEEE
ncbi:uncharacterized protein LOC116180486 [Photinus pyralis]|uniref:uncharacterized protein LOC116180486 n=1 Tax=Photinus pyralis TaxID=7054 RepID=UPI001267557F|nr:uncharacterized protein LOC116180486 [Photinus pyralis]